MKLQQIEGSFSIMKVPSLEGVDFTKNHVFIAKTEDEISVVCETSHAPKNAIHREDGWCMMRVCGTLDFGMTGVIAGISAILAAEDIPIFVVSTYDTDYILLKGANNERACAALRRNGYKLS